MAVSFTVHLQMLITLIFILQPILMTLVSKWFLEYILIKYTMYNIRTLSLVLVQPRKTRPFIKERLLMGRIESNQTNKQIITRQTDKTSFSLLSKQHK